MVAPPHQRMRSQTVFATSLVRIGRFAARPDEPLFWETSPTGHYAVVFPETELVISYERSGDFVVDPTTVTFYNPDDIFERHPISAEGDRCTWLSGPPDLLDELLHSLGEARPGSDRKFKVPVARCPAHLFTLGRRLWTRAAGPAPDPLVVEEEALSLLSRLLRAQVGSAPGAPSPVSPTTRRSVARAVDFLAANFRQSTSVQEIALHARCSPFHLCRAFKAQTGFSIHGYRTALRLRHGFDELLCAPHSITDLALDLGFSSHSHFTAMFKSAFGQTPRSIRSRTWSDRIGDQAAG